MAMVPCKSTTFGSECYGILMILFDSNVFTPLVMKRLSSSVDIKSFGTFVLLVE